MNKKESIDKEKVGAEVYVSNSSQIAPENQINDFNISYSWQPIFEPPTDKEVRVHIRQANK